MFKKLLFFHLVSVGNLNANILFDPTIIEEKKHNFWYDFKKSFMISFPISIIMSFIHIYYKKK